MCAVKIVLGLVKAISKRALRKSIGILTQLLQKSLYKITHNYDDQIWLDRMANLGLIYKGVVKFTTILGIEPIIYTFSISGRLIPTPDFLAYEPKVMKIFTPKQGEVVVDIGAYVGRYSLMASKCVGKDGIVIAVEAHPDHYQVLLKNIALNNAENIIPINRALSDRNGTCKFYIADRPGLHSIVKKTERSIKVPCITLDDLLADLGLSTVNWIKVDVEGAEYEVLRGMKQTLKKNRHLNLLIEIHSSSKDVHRELINTGFKITSVDWYHIYARAL